MRRLVLIGGLTLMALAALAAYLSAGEGGGGEATGAPSVVSAPAWPVGRPMHPGQTAPRPRARTQANGARPVDPPGDCLRKWERGKPVESRDTAAGRVEPLPPWPTDCRLMPESRPWPSDEPLQIEPLPSSTGEGPHRPRAVVVGAGVARSPSGRR